MSNTLSELPTAIEQHNAEWVAEIAKENPDESIIRGPFTEALKLKLSELRSKEPDTFGHLNGQGDDDLKVAAELLKHADLNQIEWRDREFVARLQRYTSLAQAR